MFSWYKCLIVNLVFSHIGFWRGILFLIAPFPDRCLLVPFEVNDTDSPAGEVWLLNINFLNSVSLANLINHSILMYAFVSD